MTTEELQIKLNQCNNIVEKVRMLLEEAHQSDVIYDTENHETIIAKDIALIQCFYGTDIQRIRATTQALEFNLHMTSRPSSWIFVECQLKKSDCAFTWLNRYGIKHIYVPMDSESQGIMLKNSLWNIGMANCQESKLCFVDSDVVMCNSDWIDRVSNAFECGYDVLSLASHQYYQSDEACQLYETIGYKWKTNSTVESGHCGFTFGITRRFFEKIGEFDPSLILADITVYYKIIGDTAFKPFKNWLFPVSNSNARNMGFSCNLGYADNVACHIWHGGSKSKYNDIIKLLYNSGVKSLDCILNLSKHDQLPKWNVGTQRNLAIKNVILKYQEFLKLDDDVREQTGFDIMNEYYSELSRLFGRPNKHHPLIVCTVVKNGFNVQLQDFVEFRNNVETMFSESNIKPTVLFFTDCNKLDFSSVEINTAPLKDYQENNEFVQCVRENLAYPKNSVIYYIPFGLKTFNCSLWIPNEKTEFPDGTVLIPAPVNIKVEKKIQGKNSTNKEKKSNNNN